MTNYAQHVRTTPQNEQARIEQVANNAGGFTFQLDDFGYLRRFLILGAEGGSYYATERKLTRDAAQCVERCIAADGPRTVATIVEVSDGGLAPKNDAAIFALAMASALGDEATKRAAYQALPRVCRIGTHLFNFARDREAFGGWGAGMRRAVGRWYTGKPTDKLAVQLAKYQSRDGWSHRDLLRLSHPKTSDAVTKGMFDWTCGREADLPQDNLIVGFERAKHAESDKDIISLIEQYNLPRECIPTQFLKSPAVWHAMIERGMPMTAMIRNLGRMTALGVIEPLGGGTRRRITDQLEDVEALQRARVHPVQLLTALLTYRQGHGTRGSLAWQPVPQVLNALDGAFYKAFKTIEPTNKSFLLGLDVSGSMTMPVAGVPGLTARIGAAAMALITAATEPNHMFTAFSSGVAGEWHSSDRSRRFGYWRAGISPVNISPHQRLDDVVNTLDRIPMGGTDCALPMLYATANQLPVDVFVVITDNETWHGSTHPFEALREYRQRMGRDAKLVVIGMTATQFTIADPKDPGMLDVVGFDSSAPRIISAFAGGEF